MAEDKQKLMDTAKEIDNRGIHTVPEGIADLVERGKKGENVKRNMNGNIYYSVQTEEEMYQTFVNMSKEEYLKERELKEKLQKAKAEEDRKKTAEMKETILKEDMPRWKEGFKQFYDEENYKECMKYINECFESASSPWRVERYKNNFDLALNILTASKAGDKETAVKNYIEIGGDYEDRLKSTAYELIRHSPYVEIILDAIEKDVKVWYKNEDGKDVKYMQDLKELIKKYKEQIALGEEQPGGPN